MKFRREDFTKIMFGLTALIVGILFLMCAFDVIQFKNLLPYWTLFVIIPTLGSMIANGVNIWKIALLALGINALIVQSQWGNWEWKQFIAANIAVCLILFGVLLIFGNPKSEGLFKRFDKKKEQQPYNYYDNNQSNYQNTNNQ
ncbi:MAG: hypothetical protein IJB86_10465 [Clostridia bacterium]|nr:hypothetical protein [Clostridia bacterium]